MDGSQPISHVSSQILPSVPQLLHLNPLYSQRYEAEKSFESEYIDEDDWITDVLDVLPFILHS